MLKSCNIRLTYVWMLQFIILSLQPELAALNLSSQFIVNCQKLDSHNNCLLCEDGYQYDRDNNECMLKQLQRKQYTFTTSPNINLRKENKKVGYVLLIRQEQLSLRQKNILYLKKVLRKVERVSILVMVIISVMLLVLGLVLGTVYCVQYLRDNKKGVLRHKYVELKNTHQTVRIEEDEVVGMNFV